MNKLLSNIDNFLSDFLSRYDDDILSDWKSEENQTRFKELVLSSAKMRKSKKEDKENLPKKNKSAYLYFCEAERGNVKKKYPEISNKEIISKLAELWNKIKDDENKIKIFKDLAIEDKERYNQEMSGTQVEKKTRKTSKKTVDGPKKNSSAYIHFCNEMRSVCKDENPDVDNKTIMKVLGDKWKSLDEDGKKKFNELAKKDKDRYEEEKKNWTAPEPVAVEPEPVVEKKTKKTVEKKKSKATKKDEDEVVLEDEVPVSAPVPDTKAKKPSAYINFVKEVRPVVKDELPDLQPKEIMSELGKRWKALSEEEKARYK